MDVLKSKQVAKYDYTCRYTGVPYYFSTLDKKYIYGIGQNLSKDTTYTLHTLTMSDTLDSLALKYYNNPTYWWVLAYFNDIQDSLIRLQDYFTTIKIPAISSIEFIDMR